MVSGKWRFRDYGSLVVVISGSLTFLPTIAVASPITYSESSSYFDPVFVNNGTSSSDNLFFTPDLSGGTLTNTSITINTASVFSGYSDFPIAATGFGGIVGSSNTNISYDLSSFGLPDITHTAAEIIPCTDVCGPGVSASVNFVSGSQTSSYTTSSTGSIGGSIPVKITNSQISIDNAITIGSNAINGAATVTRTANVNPIPETPPSPPITKSVFYGNASKVFAATSLFFGGASFLTPCDGFCGAISYGLDIPAGLWAMNDPADLNYTEVATPLMPKAPVLSGSPFFSTVADSISQDMLQNIYNDASLINAAQTSINRATGAYISNEYDYENLQLNALNYYYNQELITTNNIGLDMIELSKFAAISSLPKDFNSELYNYGSQIIDTTNINTVSVDEPPSWKIFIGALALILIVSAKTRKTLIL